jgi:HSP20 family molecular chaperone IbpA
MVKKEREKKKVEKKNIQRSIILRNNRPAEIPVLRPEDVRAEMNRWFDDLRSAMDERFFNPWVPASAFIDIKEPTMNIIDNGKEFVIHADMPGIPRENIEINVTPTHIEISGEYEKQNDDSRRDYVRQERVYSQFYRTSSLPAEVMAEKAAATVNNGVLEVRLPKKEPTVEKRKHKVPVN